MSRESVSLTYRRAVTEQASPVGLAIALYDTLASDLQRAAAAMHRAENHPRDLDAIQERSTYLKHALQVLGQLNALLDTANGGACAQNLARFYEHIRQRILIAQFQKAPRVLEAEVSRVLQVRAAWQQVDSLSARPAPTIGSADDTSPNSRDGQNGHHPFSCSA
jgi:flagellar biosynthetic protein FliS